MKILAALGTLLLGLALFPSAVDAKGVVNAGDFGLSEHEDATPALLDAIEACRKLGADRLVLPPGVYHVYPERAFQKYCAISNNDNGMKHIALPLIGFDGLAIDGQGAELILHGQMIAIDIENSTDVTIENLTIDWARPFHFQAEVVGVDEGAGTIDLEPLAECNVSIRGGKLVHSEIERPQVGGKLDNWWTPWVQDLRWSQFFDGETKAPITSGKGSPSLPWEMLESAECRAEKIGENRYRMFNACRDYPEPGMVVVAKGMCDYNRLSPAIRLYKAFGVTLRDVTIHHAGAMGLIGERSGDITMERLAVRLRDGGERVVTTTADATHFVGCKGLLRFEDCHFENMLDDATNVHGTYTRVEKRTGPRTVLAKLMHFQQFGFTFAEAGDAIRFSSRETLVPYAEATATDVRIINEQYMEITFDRDLDGLLRDDGILDNLSWQASVHMRGCTLSRNRARSILLSTAGDVLIEDNTFDRSSMMNILMEGDAYVWHESCPARNVRIVGNRFLDLNPAAEMIRISPKLPKGVVPEKPYHENITIEGNTFETLSPRLVTAEHAARIVFRGNKIVPARGYETTAAKSPSFELANCRGVTIDENESRLPDRLSVRADERTNGLEVGAGVIVEERP